MKAFEDWVNRKYPRKTKSLNIRKGSSYWEHLEGLNQRFQSQHKPPVKLRSAPEDLEDEDLLEMLNAGLVSVTITNAYLPRLWANIYGNIKPNPAVVL